MKRRLDPALLTCALLATATWIGPAGAGDRDERWPLPFLDPLRWSSLPLDPQQAARPTTGGWRLAVTAGYFNAFNGSWHTGAIYREFGLQGTPLSVNQLRLLEQRHPEDDIYRIDLEGWRIDLVASRALAHGLAMQIDLPVLRMGNPHWDGLPLWFHERVGVSQNDRSIFPRGETVLYAFSQGRRAEAFDEFDGTFLADASLSMSGPIAGTRGSRHRWVVALEPPTGDRDSVGGSGGWDAGVRWSGRWSVGRVRLEAGAGYTWLDSDGDWNGLARADTWHLLFEFRRRMSARFDFRAGARLDESPLRGFDGSKLGEPSLFLDFGARLRTRAGTWVGFDLGENVPDVGVGPDFTLQLQVGLSLDRSERPPETRSKSAGPLLH